MVATFEGNITTHSGSDAAADGDDFGGSGGTYNPNVDVAADGDFGDDFNGDFGDDFNGDFGDDFNGDFNGDFGDELEADNATDAGFLDSSGTEEGSGVDPVMEEATPTVPDAATGDDIGEEDTKGGIGHILVYITTAVVAVVVGLLAYYDRMPKLPALMIVVLAVFLGVGHAIYTVTSSG